jgi:hypothetical protein
LARGVIVASEVIRKECRTFGHQYANQLRPRRPQPGETWYLFDVFLTINGARHDLWRAVDQDGNGFDLWSDRPTLPTGAASMFCPCLPPSDEPMIRHLAAITNLPPAASVSCASGICVFLRDDHVDIQQVDHAPVYP